MIERINWQQRRSRQDRMGGEDEEQRPDDGCGYASFAVSWLEVESLGLEV